MVRELSERARVAERALRQQRAAAAAQKRPPIRVRASVQPTFVRFVFEMPDGVSVSSVLNDQRLSLLFNAALTFDLADAKVAAPSNIASINQKIERETSLVEVVLIGDVDVRSFREEKNYIIDVAFQQPEKPPAQRSPLADASHAPAAAAPAAAPAASARPPAETSGSRPASEIVPPTSETLRPAGQDRDQARSGGEGRARVRPRRRRRRHGDCQSRRRPPRQRLRRKSRRPQPRLSPAAAACRQPASNERRQQLRRRRNPGAAAGRAAAGRREPRIGQRQARQRRACA